MLNTQRIISVEPVVSKRKIILEQQLVNNNDQPDNEVEQLLIRENDNFVFDNEIVGVSHILCSSIRFLTKQDGKEVGDVLKKLCADRENNHQDEESLKLQLGKD